MITLSVRGAVSVDRNTSESIQSAVVKLVSLLEKENGIREEDLTMILFSVTADLTALNPAAALRRGGAHGSAALFCVQEPVYDGSLPMTVRVLIQFCTEEKRPLKPIYLGAAAALRPDLTGQEGSLRG